MIPTVQAIAFFIEIGPLVAALLLAGRVGSGIGAVLANMRATEQIDGIESLSIDSFKFLVVPRVENFVPPLYRARIRRYGLVQLHSAHPQDCGFRLHHRNSFFVLRLHHQ